jgi:hypothetical protein
VNAANTPIVELNRRVGYRIVRNRLLLQLPADQLPSDA